MKTPDTSPKLAKSGRQFNRRVEVRIMKEK
jgi:hypothetical protein